MTSRERQLALQLTDPRGPGATCQSLRATRHQGGRKDVERGNSATTRFGAKSSRNLSSRPWRQFPAILSVAPRRLRVVSEQISLGGKRLTADEASHGRSDGQWQHYPDLDWSVRRLELMQACQARQNRGWHIPHGVRDAERVIDREWQRGKRIVVEHVVLLKMKDNLSEEEEKDMLDHVFTLQYMIRSILAALSDYYANPSLTSVSEKYVSPHCEDMLVLDFEAEVDDDIEPVFRRGEELCASKFESWVYSWRGRQIPLRQAEEQEKEEVEEDGEEGEEKEGEEEEEEEEEEEGEEEEEE
ncbi:hypothetical protein CBR_g57728 [Chara braunii]|uniref:Uncharacterized protein n=1 Tax=Chara braunii TaxID=69332 RepID=A0A388MEJ0_CHABU|nr:hypothetical protein CBR_g57728 [Chara braunii]|eukprot:GBG92909.1 hypothetical protein CBR_g57728 [Chara braunii]